MDMVDMPKTNQLRVQVIIVLRFFCLLDSVRTWAC